MLMVIYFIVLLRSGNESGTHLVHHFADPTCILWVKLFFTLIRPAYQRVPDYRITVEIGSDQRGPSHPAYHLIFFKK